MNRKMESLPNGISNGFHSQSCENLKENLKLSSERTTSERSVYKVITRDSNSHSKLTIKLKIDARSLSSSGNCSIHIEEENMENRADKGKHKIKQSE